MGVGVEGVGTFYIDVEVVCERCLNGVWVRCEFC